jgi:hypothetical protein
VKPSSRALIGFCCCVALANAADAPAPAFDATRLKTGTFTYQDSVDGKPGDTSSCSVAREGDGYRFSCDFPAYDQSWKTIATHVMSPVSTELRMRTRQGRHYVMTLQYQGLKVKGDAVTSRSRDERLPGADRAVEGDITPDTVDQRIDWATVMASDMQPGQSFEFKVYDASTALSRVHCEVGDAGMMDAPGGRIPALRFTYTVYKSTGTELYTVYASAVFPRVMLREDLPGKLVSTLVKMEP